MLWGIVTGVLCALLSLLVWMLPARTRAGARVRRALATVLDRVRGARDDRIVGRQHAVECHGQMPPLTLSGQMIVFETLFALLYAFVYEGRLPRGSEVLAVVLLVTGVC